MWGLAFTIWLVARSEGVSATTVPVLFGAVGLLVIAGGIVLMRRKVILGAESIAVEGALGRREIAISKLAGVRMRDPQGGRAPSKVVLLIVRDADGRRIAISVPDRAVSSALLPWLKHVCECVARRWREQLEVGETVQVCKDIQLKAGELVVRKRSLALNGACTLREDAPGTARAVLTLENGRDCLNVDAEYDNYLPLVLAVRQLIERGAGLGG